jgi:hypothetical protein
MKVPGFWLTPECNRIPCTHHYVPAQRVFPDLQPGDAREHLLKMGYVRCVISGDDLFYERRGPVSEKQMAELKNIALEEGLRLMDDKGNVIVHELPTWTQTTSDQSSKRLR